MRDALSVWTLGGGPRPSLNEMTDSGEPHGRPYPTWGMQWGLDGGMGGLVGESGMRGGGETARIHM